MGFGKVGSKYSLDFDRQEFNVDFDIFNIVGSLVFAMRTSSKFMSISIFTKKWRTRAFAVIPRCNRLKK
jgi:hypothetical protein